MCHKTLWLDREEAQGSEALEVGEWGETGGAQAGANLLLVGIGYGQ